ncbi:MAG TPA: magnesium chelatase [Vicinamibacteria bacterium]|nr:magnesium chelatase [Vicinamibacteria bacterium]
MREMRTLGELSKSSHGERRNRGVRDEIRENLIRRMRAGEELFPGIVGYEESVVPQIVNALLSRHHFILLGLRGQAKTRIIRGLSRFLDEKIPVIEGCEIHDDPYRPICLACRRLVSERGDETPIRWLPREARYVEKLATPDVTIADMIGDLDPIRAAKSGLHLSDELTIHYGLVPRAHRGIFAINELPDLAAKIQVGLFNILQEGDVQIKGYPVRLPLDLLMVFTANPEDYTARGRTITPLKDRIGAEIRTHYPATLEQGVAITRSEAWTERAQQGTPVVIPYYLREIVEEVAIQARGDRRVDKRSGVSQRLPITLLESVVSSGERRALLDGDEGAVPRVSDIYASLPAITGKLELEYEGELKGAETIARELIRRAVGRIFQKYASGADFTPVVEWFDRGGYLRLPDSGSASDALGALRKIPGLLERTSIVNADETTSAGERLAAAEFLLEGLVGLKRVSRSEERGYHGSEERRTEIGYEDAIDSQKTHLN